MLTPPTKPTDVYHPISRFLHWLMGIFIICMFVMGWGRDFAGPEMKDKIMVWHVSVGLVLLALFFVRLASRINYAAPDISGARPERVAAHVAHFFLYVLMFVMPLTGWLYISARGVMPRFLGVGDIPALLQKDRALAVFFKDLHETLAYGFAALVILHALAAFHRHFFRRDGTLKKMAPGLVSAASPDSPQKKKA